MIKMLRSNAMSELRFKCWNCGLHPPIGGHHPVPCLSTQITERDRVQQCTRRHENATNDSCLSYVWACLLPRAIEQRAEGQIYNWLLTLPISTNCRKCKKFLFIKCIKKLPHQVGTLNHIVDFDHTFHSYFATQWKMPQRACYFPFPSSLKIWDKQ